MTRLLVLLLSLLFASVSFAQRRSVVERPLLAGAPHLSNEVAVSDPVYVAGAHGQRPRIAAGPDQALVVWSEGVVRVDDEGRPLDVVPLVTPGEGPGGPQDAAWNGTNYVVGVTRDTATGEVISLVGVGADGHVGTPLDIERTSNANVYLAMAARGDELAIAYSMLQPDGSNTITVLIVNHGVVTARVPLGKSDEPMSSGRVIASTNGYMVVWPHNYRYVGEHGSIVTGGTLSQRELDVAFQGPIFTFAAADSNGVVVFTLSNKGIGPRSDAYVGPARSPAIAWNGKEYRMLWQAEHRSTQPNGTTTFDLFSWDEQGKHVLVPNVWSTDFRFVPGPDADAIAAVGKHFIGVWSSGPPLPSSNRLIYAANIDTPDVAPHLVSYSAVTQTLNGLIATPRAARAFWQESGTLRSASIDASGRRGEASDLFTNHTAFYAWNGFETIAAWSDASSIHVSALDDDGQVTRDATLVTTSNQLDALACNAHDCAIVWTFDLKQYFQRFTANGTLLDQPLELAAPGFVRLAGGGDEYLLVMRWPAENGSHLITTRFADGKLSDITDLQVDAQPYLITAASRPDGWLVVAQTHVFALDGNGAIRGEAELPVYWIPPSAAWDGRNWIVAWQDFAYPDIKAARITADGTLVDLFAVAATPSAETAPLVRSFGDGRAAIAYQRSTSDPLFGISSRVFVRWLSE